MRHFPFFAAFILSTLLFGSFSAQSASAAPNSWTLDSPDGHVQLFVQLSERGELSYLVRCRGEVVVEPSPLGIIREDAGFEHHLEFLASEGPRTTSITYSLTQGKQIECRDHRSSLILHFATESGKKIDLHFATFNRGVAFRYSFPLPDDRSNPEEKLRIIKEMTGFQIPRESRFWAQPYDEISKYTPAYERFYVDGIPSGTKAPGEQGWAFPMLLQTKQGTWMLITEAGLCEQYCGTRIAPKVENNLYRIRFPDPREGNHVGSAEPRVTLPMSTPWRTIITSPDLGEVVTSNIVTHLNPPNRFEQTDWIAPGRVSWSWISDHPSPRDARKLKKFVDLAAEMDWEYTLVDANWNMMQHGDVDDVLEYAREKGVGVLLWYNSGGPHNTVTEAPRDRMHLPEVRREEFAKLQEKGVVGVKIDFFQSDKQSAMALYRDMLADAAEAELLVDFHGCTVPRGWVRTYPNLMTMEAVFGAEAYSFNADYSRKAPKHNTILPFTRNVVGAMDYTPVMFHDNKYPHITTHAHELALSVIFQSGLLHFADSVEGFRAQPEPVKRFLRDVPVVWHETTLIDGFPGKSAVLARRHEDSWYLGGINGEKQRKEVAFPLDFLGPGKYRMLLISDGEGPRDFQVVEKTVTALDGVDLEMLPHGGFAIQWLPTGN